MSTYYGNEDEENEPTYEEEDQDETIEINSIGELMDMYLKILS